MPQRARSGHPGSGASRYSALLICVVLLGLGAHAGAQQDAPTKPAPAKAQAKKKNIPPPARPEYYVVQSGENLTAIAKRYGLDYRAVAEWNNIPYPRRVEVGQRLRMYPPGVFPDSPPQKAPAAASSPAAVGGAETSPNAAPDRAVPGGVAAAQMAGAATTDANFGSITFDTEPARPVSSAAELRLPRSDYPTVTPELVAAAQAQEVQSGVPSAVSPPSPGAGAEAKGAPSEEALAKEREQLEVLRKTTLNLIQLLVESGILTQEKADALVQEAKRSAAQSSASAAGAQAKVVRVPYVPQFMRDEMQENIKKEVVAQAKEEGWATPNALPSWLDRFSFYGDFRLRYQANFLSPTNDVAVDVQDTNAGNGLVLLNTTENSEYFRYQLRFGFDAKVNDEAMVGVRLSSGNTGNPVSLNQTLGNSFNKNSVVIDLAYLRLDPYSWLTLWGGRMPNPYFFTDLIWYDQLNFDGFAAKTRTELAGQSNLSFILGAFPVETIDCTTAISVSNCGSNKWLYGAQTVFEKALRSSSSLKLGLAYYVWNNYEGKLNSPVVNPADRTSIPKFAQKGNTYFNVVTDGGNPLLGLAANFNVIDLTASLDLGNWDPVRVIFTGDVAKNIGYDQAEIAQRTGGLVDQPPRTNAWYARVNVGMPTMQQRGDWQAYVGYKYVQRDSVVDGYNDPDFHFGGTDAKGYLVGVLYGISKHTYARLRWMSANSIDGPALAWDVLQLDLFAYF